MGMVDRIGLMVALLLAWGARSFASEPATLASFRCQLYATYVEGRVAEWGRLLPEMEKSYAATKDRQVLLEIARTRYGFVAFLIKEKRGKDAEVNIEKGLANVELLLRQNPKDAEAMVLKASFLAFSVELWPLGAIINAPKSLRQLELAYHLAPANAYVLMDKANAKQYLPVLFGGNLSEAVAFYKKSITAFEKMDQRECRWVYLNALANLGTCYVKMGEYANAEAIYRKALAVAPEFDWVKRYLLPQLHAKMKAKK